MPALPNDYDSDPSRWASRDPAVQMHGDVHQPVAERLIRENLAPVLDVGGGPGTLASLLPAARLAVVIDLSPTQLAAAPEPKVLAHAAALPISGGSVGAVAMLWMLYHLGDVALVELQLHARDVRDGYLSAEATKLDREAPSSSPDLQHTVTATNPFPKEPPMQLQTHPIAHGRHETFPLSLPRLLKMGANALHIPIHADIVVLTAPLDHEVSEDKCPEPRHCPAVGGHIPARPRLSGSLRVR